MYKNKMFLVIIIILLTILMTGCIQLEVNNKYEYDDTNYSFGNMAFSDTINQISVDWLVGKIIIKKSENHELIIREETDANIKDEYKMHYLLTDDKLDIKFVSSFEQLNYTFKIKTLYIFLPIKIENIQINSYLSDVDIDEVTIKELSLNSTAGDISIDDTQIDNISINTISGSIIFFDNICKEIKFVTQTGNIGINYQIKPDVLSIQTQQGNTVIYVLENDPFVVEFITQTGKFDSNLEYTILENKYVINETNTIYKVITNSGKLKVLKK